MTGKWKRVSPRGTRPVGGRKENEENERVRGIYTLLYNNRVIDLQESAANNNAYEVGIVWILETDGFCIFNPYLEI